MQEVIFNAYTKDGKLHIRNRKQFDKEVCELEGELEVVVRKKKRYRGLQANRYLWGVIVPAIRDGMIEQGHEVSKEDVWQFLKHRFNYTEVLNEGTGEVMHFPKTTTNLTSTEFATFIENCIQFAAEFLGVVIEPPNTQTEISY